MATRLSDNYGHPVLVIVDELDVVKDTSGLASFIKNASSPDLKFILVGIGQNVSSLLGDHQSIERIVAPVQVPCMEDPDLAQIIERAMEGLAELGLNYSFNRSSSRLLVRLASGFPWFVHLLGQEALLTAHRSRRTAVTREDVEAAIISLAGNRFAQQFREQYRRAIRDSPTREKVLRAFARYRNQTIPTSEIFPVLRRVGVKNPSPYVRDLSSEAYGAILLRSPFHERGAWRFENEMFKVYARVCLPTFDIDEQLRQAWRAEFQGTAFADDAEPLVSG